MKSLSKAIAGREIEGGVDGASLIDLTGSVRAGALPWAAPAGPWRLIQRFDGGHLAINALVNGGAHTTDAGIAAVFAPLPAMESLRPRIQGAGNLERFAYWRNPIRATQLRVQTWVLAARLHCRPLGEGAFKPVPAAHRARQAYRVALPAQSEGALADHRARAQPNHGGVVS